MANKNKTISTVADTSSTKYLVYVVAGQSNAVGYDESIVTELELSDKDARIKQLGLYDNDNLQVIELGTCAQSFQDMRTFTNSANFGGATGTKGIHLPLMKQLLPHIPDDYTIVVVPAAYGGTGFLGSKGYGTYNETTMKPSDGMLKWGVESAYYKAMKNRVKHLLDLNAENKFGGVIWCQGENDSAGPASDHFTAFTAMADDFNTYFETNYKDRSVTGTWDANIWFIYETCNYWRTSGFNGSGVINGIWNNYKTWTPDNYVTIDVNTDTNNVNGTGSTSSTKTSHFGNGVFRNVIAPRVARAMLKSPGYANFYKDIPADSVNTYTVVDAKTSDFRMGQTAVLGCEVGSDGILKYTGTAGADYKKDVVWFNNDWDVVLFDAQRAGYWTCVRSGESDEAMTDTTPIIGFACANRNFHGRLLKFASAGKFTNNDSYLNAQLAVLTAGEKLLFIKKTDLVTVWRVASNNAITRIFSVNLSTTAFTKNLDAYRDNYKLGFIQGVGADEKPFDGQSSSASRLIAKNIKAISGLESTFDPNDSTQVTALLKQMGVVVPQPTEIILTPSAVNMKVEGKEQEFTVTTAASSYKISQYNATIFSLREDAANKKFYLQVKPTATGAKPQAQAYVTVTATADGQLEGSAVATITLEDKEVAPAPTPSLEVTPDSSSLKVGKTQVFTITHNAADYGYEITPSDIATFDKATKTLTATKAGSGKIAFFINKDLDTEVKKEVALTIAEADVTNLTIKPENLTLQVGANSVIEVTTNADDYTVSNSNTGVATFDKTTKTVTAVTVGSAILTFKAKFGEGAEVSKTLTVSVEAVPVEETTLTVTPNGNVNLIKGDKQVFDIVTNADDFTAEVNNTDLATFDKASKTLTTLKAGDAIVTFKATKVDSVEKTVTANVSIKEVSLTADKSEATIGLGKDEVINVTTNVVNELVVSVDNTDVVAYSRNGAVVTLSAIKVGSANVTLTVRDQSLTIPVTVTTDTTLSVYPKIEQITIGKSQLMTVTTNASDYTVEVDDDTILSYTKNGKSVEISGLKEGIANITIKATADGGKEATASWQINVIEETAFTQDETVAILGDKSTTIAQKLEKFTNDIGNFGQYVTNMTDYELAMNPDAPTPTDDKGAGRNYNLYIQIKDTASQEDYDRFKVEFDIVNMVYTQYKDGAFDEFQLFRFDRAWTSKWGEKSLTTFQNLNTVICALCDISTRQNNLATIDLDKALDPTKIELSDIAINNIKKYYTI